ncbi:spore protease YyaC [Mobilitalea sibirica]|uniref:Spore protease YyaC n=1 Tax=Mobilitalea sibirica TaxID=1462919 RepID=A0A8J7KT90_9FIRM|nr:spore protease YyaC [Mobilitalea sibirica]MBH1941121.1 spore protease YyaC [Mobilitalea sibirica]
MSIFVKSKNRITYFNSSEKNTAYELGRMLSDLMKRHVLLNKTIIFLCIGSDRATGDCLGPIIGYKLSKYKKLYNYYVYGTLEEPVHAKNLKSTVDMIYQAHEDAFIIAIDASLGKSDHIGYITLGEGPLKPGAGVNKDLPAVGDIYITGIVNFSGLLDHMLLQTTRLNVVMSLADQICQAINYSIYNLNSYTLQ